MKKITLELTKDVVVYVPDHEYEEDGLQAAIEYVQTEDLMTELEDKNLEDVFEIRIEQIEDEPFTQHPDLGDIVDMSPEA